MTLLYAQMRVGILHGWSLTGSGSNVYVQNISRSLWKLGHEVIVFCQDQNAGELPFVASIQHHDNKGGHEERSLREEGIQVEIPSIGHILPVFVWDDYPDFERVVEFQKLSRKELVTYLQANVDLVARRAEALQLDVLHANHAIMMPEIARQVNETTGIPYVIALHGSALVYAVDRNRTCYEYALRGLESANRILVGNDYFRNRVISIFESDYHNISSMITQVPLGVDTETFVSIRRDSRSATISVALETHRDFLQGRSSVQANTILKSFENYVEKEEVSSDVFEFAGQYSQKHPDNSLATTLSQIDWSLPLIIYVGRLILGKGPQDLVIAFTELVKRVQCQLLIVGSGPIREWLELLVWLRQREWSSLVEQWLEVGLEFASSSDLLDTARLWVDRLPSQWEALNKLRVFFTGYMDHRLLRLVLPTADIAVFPSLVPESFGLVVLEAASAGVVPLVSDFSGLRDSAQSFEANIQALDDGDLRFPIDPRTRLVKLVSRLEKLLRISQDVKVREELRDICEGTYSWLAVTKDLEAVYESVLNR